MKRRVEGRHPHLALSLLIPTLSILTGCAGGIVVHPKGEDSKTRTADDPIYDELFSTYRQIYEVRIDSGTRTRTTRGFVEHRHKLEREGIYYVYAIRDLDTPVGFYIPSGKTFRYEKRGVDQMEAVEIGGLEPDDAIRTLLDFSGDVELDEQARAWKE